MVWSTLSTAVRIGAVALLVSPGVGVAVNHTHVQALQKQRSHAVAEGTDAGHHDAIMLNSRHTSSSDDEVAHHVVSSLQKKNGHHHSVRHRRSRRNWEKLAVSQKESADKTKERVARIFEQGRMLRERKAEFYKRLGECPHKDHTCERRLIAEQVKAEQELARNGGRAFKPKMRDTHLVKDEMGRTMPLLFKGNEGFTTPVPETAFSEVTSELVSLSSSVRKRVDSLASEVNYEIS